jgi:hypothetical protein
VKVSFNFFRGEKNLMKIVNLFLKLLVMAGFFFYVSDALAFDFDCFGTMHVTINNRTSGTCRSIPSQGMVITSGWLKDGFPYGLLVSGASLALDFHQGAFYGSEVILAYDCTHEGENQFRQIIFEVSQDVSLFQGHTPSLKVLQSNKLTARAANVVSSSVFSGGGTVTVNIEEI